MKYQENDFFEPISGELRTYFVNLVPTYGLGRPRAGTGLKPPPSRKPKIAVFPRYLRVGRTSSDVMPTATIITAITSGLRSIESVAGEKVP